MKPLTIKGYKVNQKGHLLFGGCDTVDLAKTYGTPLYCLDKNAVVSMCNVFSNALKDYGNFKLLYASKALCNTAVHKIVTSQGFGVDVVSGGELATAIAAGVKPQDIYFHGNNKLLAELESAIDYGVTIVIDCIDEISIVAELLQTKSKSLNVLLRVNPGVEAHTHHYVQTARKDSKFGLGLDDGVAMNAVKMLQNIPQIKLQGLHCHIGSQIFDNQAYKITADKVLDFYVAVKQQLSVEFEVFNIGGGFGIYYAEGDDDKDFNDYKGLVSGLAAHIKNSAQQRNLRLPTLILEPGRSIVGAAGITLYTVGNIKNIDGTRKYVSVDGGMFDNPRYALYQAKYSALIANKANKPLDDTVTIAGKCCESGDLVAVNVPLQVSQRGDIMAVFSTGAYNYSMASNYNRNLIPAMILVDGEKHGYIVKPQTYQDIIRNDATPDFLD